MRRALLLAAALAALGRAATAQSIGTPGVSVPGGASAQVSPSVGGPVGTVLTVSGVPAGSSYQWQRAGSNIAGATGATYTTVSGDAGNSVGAAVTFQGVAIKGGLTCNSTLLPTASVSRQASWWPVLMVSSYSGPLFRIQRVSDGAQEDVYPKGSGGCLNAPDYAAIDAWTGGTDPNVTTVYDQEGGGNNLTQATTANMPFLSSVVTSGNIRPFQVRWQYLATASREWFVIPNLAVNTRNFGAIYGLDPVAPYMDAVHFELYSTSTAILGTYTQQPQIGLYAETPSVQSTLQPPMFPQVIALTGNASGRVVTLFGGSQTISVATAATQNTTGFFGKSTPGADAFAGNYDFYGMSVYAATPTQTDISNAQSAINATFGFYTGGATYQLIYGGSSLITGNGVTKNNTMPRLVRAQLGSAWAVWNTGSAGSQLSQEYASRASRDEYALSASYAKSVVVIDAPSNDIGNATAYASCAAAQAAADSIYSSSAAPLVAALMAVNTNVRVVVPTIISRSNWDTTSASGYRDCARQEYNTDVRNGAATNGYVVSDRTTFAPFNTTPTSAYFIADLIHPNDAGYAQMTLVDYAAIIAAAGT